MPDRRRFTTEDEDLIGHIVSRQVRHELEDRASLTKNGHTWTEWLRKVFTLDRAILGGIAIISMVYTFGGDVRDAREQLRKAADKADIASTKAEAAATKSEAAAETNTQLQQQLKDVVEAQQQQRVQQEAFRADMRSKLSVTVTRQEFNEAVERRILPRLERIEKAQPTP